MIKFCLYSFLGWYNLAQEAMVTPKRHITQAVSNPVVGGAGELHATRALGLKPMTNSTNTRLHANCTCEMLRLCFVSPRQMQCYFLPNFICEISLLFNLVPLAVI